MISAVIPMRYVLFCALVCVPHMVWAIAAPIGALTTLGKVTVVTNGVPIGLDNEEYAYFSSDGVTTPEGTSAVLTTPDGLKIKFAESSGGTVSSVNGVYHINVIAGQMFVAAADGVMVELFSNGQQVALQDNATEGNDLVLSANSENKTGQAVSGVGVASVILLLATGTAVVMDGSSTSFSTENVVVTDDKDSSS